MALPSNKSTLSKKKQKRKVAGGHSTGNKKQGEGFYTVICERHGMKTAKNPYPWLKVSSPKNKRQRRSGCPKCRSENAAK